MNSDNRLFLRASGVIVLVALSVVALRSYLPPDTKVLPGPKSLAMIHIQ
ncbi:hypothetical protein R2360_08165 [Mycobacteroides chelonae]|nr:hypothetical protein [Mycobacteroides chelonae]MEC4839560.1 hypothetical protein [Mycobacteroides chelonae]MEC4844324.1 hypothetical protein [Mycobacteroides chelonae]MEC4870665.1 hypothetical protein [Mycobacteroides chelonae]MEC4904600.1 hypothetical protein [Mycobacteroides chelonae]